MFRLSKLTDYAIVVMRSLSQETSKVQNANDIAKHTHLTTPTVSKLLKRLSKAGLLQSQIGVNGGYRLAQMPTQISIAQIIHAIEGGHGLTECSDGMSHCFLESVCEMRGHWQVINQVIYKALHAISLADLQKSSSRRILQAAKNASGLYRI